MLGYLPVISGLAIDLGSNGTKNKRKLCICRLGSNGAESAFKLYVVP